MKIENYRGKLITEEDINYIKNIFEETTMVDIYSNKMYEVFDNLILNKYDKDSFIKLSYISSRLLRNYDDERAFTLGLKLSYNLIDLGENEKEHNNDSLLEYRLTDLYLILSYIIVNDGISTIPYSTKSEKFNIEKDNNLALKYLEKAILYDPNNSYIKMSLGMYYYNEKNFYKAYDYLINTKEFIEEKWSYPEFLDINLEFLLFTKLGLFFDEKKDETYTNEIKAYLCFEAAYSLMKKCDNLEKDTLVCACYNMAYAYIKGIGVEVNIEKGKQYLDELDKDLRLKFDDDISNIDDPDKIIKDYYFSNMMDNINDLCILGKLSNNEYEIKKVIKTKKLELKEFKVPNYITNINAYAFKACSNLKKLEFSKSVKIIGEDAFFECYNLDKIYYDGTIEDWCNITFSNYYSNPMKYANHFYIKNSNGEYEEVTEIVIPNNITSIGDYQFFNFSFVKSITIPSSVISIGHSAFDGCNSVTSIKIPNSVISIAAGAFARCSNLTRIEIPNSVTSIEDYAFHECTSLTIYCEAESKSETWSDDWNSENCKVIWNYKKIRK